MERPTGHPRLYFDHAELAALRSLRDRGHHALIWRNLRADALRHAHRTPPTGWIAPIADDPTYENLYDRFWTIMSDAATVEQLAFAAAYGADEQLTGAATRWLLAVSARWSPETTVPPDYGSAYATTRILKAVAIGYDLLHEHLTTADRARLRDLLRAAATRLAHEWFSRPDVRGPVGTAPGRHSPHHSCVEWSAFGIVALALLPDVPEAAGWVATVVRHYTDHLLPRPPATGPDPVTGASGPPSGALAIDGSHSEGTAFWASTVLSHLQFLDPLRRGTGQDLLTPTAAALDVRMAEAIFRPDRELTGTGEPIYGDSTGISAVLLKLAAERGDPYLQGVALTERCTGRMETWPARTPRHGAQLRIAIGGYAYAWYRPELVPAPADRSQRVWHFPLAGEAYARTGWGPDDALVAVREGKVSVSVGARLVFDDLTPCRLVDVERSVAAGTGVYRFEPPDLVAEIVEVTERAGEARIRCADPAGRIVVTVTVTDREVVVERSDGHRRTWVGSGVTVTRGRIEATDPTGHRPDLRAGYGLLDVVETDPRSYPTMKVVPDSAAITVRIPLPGAAG